MMHEISPRELNRHLVCLNRRRAQFMAGRLASHGLVGPMYTILLCLGNRPGINQDFLCSYLSIDKGTVARLARRLEELGYISRSTCESDRRANQLDLTEAGHGILFVIHEHLNQWSDKLLAGFSETDRQTALSLLQRMTDNTAE
jgi:DNA-binding MarR family transcriptional regulator